MSLDTIAQLRDPDLFMGSVQRECIARVENVPVDARQAAVYVTGFLKNASFVAQTVNTMCATILFVLLFSGEVC